MGLFSHEEKDKYRLIFDFSPEAIVILDLKGNVTDINGRVFDWLGFKPEEMIGKNLAQIPFLNKESLLRAQENFKKRMAGEKIPPYELDFVTKNGDKVVGRVMASQITDRNKKTTGLIVMISDITKYKEAEEDLKESEEKYRRLVELAQEGIWLIDEKAITTFVNPRMAEILNYKPEEMIGRHLFSFMDKKEVEIAQKNIERRKKGIKEQHDYR
jgi:PAS domain S-box-containing protein